jgi:hypothetical protein
MNKLTVKHNFMITPTEHVIGAEAEESVYGENWWRSDDYYFLHAVIYFDP